MKLGRSSRFRPFSSVPQAPFNRRPLHLHRSVHRLRAGDKHFGYCALAFRSGFRWLGRTNGSPSHGPRSLRSKPERAHPFAQHARNGLGSRCRSPNWRPSAAVVRLARHFLGTRRVWTSVLAGCFRVTGNVGNVSSKRSASSRYGARLF
jgi:hypothetical protein